MSTNNDIILLDGGMGDELQHKLPQQPWSPYILDSHPEVVIATHMEFIAAGACVIETWYVAILIYSFHKTCKSLIYYVDNSS